MNVLVLGGGLAGLACALELAESGVNVRLLEAADRLGGKAASWRDEDGHIVDFGQHVVTPLYEHLLNLLERVGAADGLRWKGVKSGQLAAGAVLEQPQTENGVDGISGGPVRASRLSTTIPRASTSGIT